MVKPPSCEKLQMEEGIGTEDEAGKRLPYLSKQGIGNCRTMPKKTGEKAILCRHLPGIQRGGWIEMIMSTNLVGRYISEKAGIISSVV
jgi:hypothetical protein